MKRKWQKQSQKMNWLLGSLIVFLLAIGIGSAAYVYASLSATDHVSNDFQLSDLTGSIDEEFTPPTKEDPMTPGRTYPKKVTINNPSATPLFVRVLVTPEIVSKDGVLLSGIIGKELTVDLGKEWLLGEDGYYYYLGKVEKNQTTSPLFTKVILSKEIDSEYDGATMKVFIKSETIIAKGTHYRDAWWLGTIPTENKLKQVDTTLQGLIK